MTYETKEQSSQVTRKATHDEMWLNEQLERIYAGCDGLGESLALESLAFELREKNQKLEGEAKVMRDLLREVIDFVDVNQDGVETLVDQVKLALRGTR